MIGCAGILALVAFILGLPFSFFFTVDHWSHRFLIALMPAAFTFFAAILLCLRDQSAISEHVSAVRRSLSQRPDTSDNDFVVSNSNQTLLLQTRDAIANYFDVPAAKLLPNDDLRIILRADKLDPSFQMYVVDWVVANNADDPQPFMFGLDGINTIVDLSAAIEDVVDGFGNEGRANNA
jgi:hypothetical protein